MWSSALDVILTTLRYLAPATLLTLFWGKQGLLFRILRHIDVAIKSIVYSSDEQRKTVLKWLEEAGPVEIEHLDTVWRHGWILCKVLDSALPGACAGHPPTKLSLKHGQTIADHYLGVEPVFSREELESIDSLNTHNEWKLTQYLDRIREALGKLTPPVSIPNSRITTPDTPQFTLDYISRGSGLTAAQINNKMNFKIFPTSQQSLDPGEITILIRGPKDIYGMAVSPPVLGKAQTIRQKLLGLQSKDVYTKSVLPFTHGAGYLRSYGKPDMHKMFHIPKTIYDIDIEVKTRPDHIKVAYIVPAEGKYEISITSRGLNIVGSPFTVTASNNIIEILENDSFCLEDGEEIDIHDVKNDRKVVLRIVDFVTEKMLLKENGSFEKITEEEAKFLMTVDDTLNNTVHQETLPTDGEQKFNRFQGVSLKIKTMIKICKIFQEILQNKRLNDTYNTKTIPDIVNSTFNDNTVIKDNISHIIIPDSFTLLLQTEKSKTIVCNVNDKKDYFEKQSQSVTPENNILSTTVSAHDMSFTDKRIIVDTEYDTLLLQTEKINTNLSNVNDKKDFFEKQSQGSTPPVTKIMSSTISSNMSFVDKTNIVGAKDDVPLLQTEKTNLCNVNDKKDFFEKQFLIETYPENTDLSTTDLAHVLFSDTTNIIATKDDAQKNYTNPKTDDTEDMPIEILIERDSSSNTPEIYEFNDVDILELERPKTPILKIITGELHNRKDSPFFNPNHDKNDTYRSNEFLNPLFTHNHRDNTREIIIEKYCKYPAVDFIIGAPVSLPPLLKAPSPEPDMDSIILASNLDEALYKYEIRKQKKQQEIITTGTEFEIIDQNLSDINTIYLQNEVTLATSIPTSTFRSIDSNFEDKSHDSNDTRSNSFGDYSMEEIENNDVKMPKKDTWDSAYVSIDESNTLPDSNNENVASTEQFNKQKNMPNNLSGQKKEIFPQMGPAEREIWQTCNEMEDQTPKISDEVKICKWEFKRPIFTPIIEESDRSLSTGLKEFTEPDRQAKDDPVSVAFAELNDIFHEYCPNSDHISITSSVDTDQNEAKEVEYITEYNIINVESASELVSDVIRQRKQIIEGTISEVQPNVTESSSASRAFQNSNDMNNKIIADLYNSSVEELAGQTQFGEKIDNNFVLKRKKYWDEKIRVNEELNSQQFNNKKKLSPKHLRRNDSLTKRKQIVINFLTAGETNEKELSNHTYENNCMLQGHIPKEVKLVEKWKKYWDDILITEKEALNTNCFISKTRKKDCNPSKTTSMPQNYTSIQTATLTQTNMPLPQKQEITEEVFKAFETSPKRFFGTSRKQIINKIDAFLGKENPAEIENNEIDDVHQENGIVSSRISLYHNINKSDSHPKRPSTNNDIITSETFKAEIAKGLSKLKSSKENKDDNTILENDSILKDTDLANNKVYAINHNHNKQTGDTNITNNTDQTNSYHSKLIESDKRHKLQSSKSEMDIFNKFNIINISEDFDRYKSCDELPKINVKSFINLYEMATKSASIDPNQHRKRMTKRTFSGGDKRSQYTSEFEDCSSKSDMKIPKLCKSYNVTSKQIETSISNSQENVHAYTNTYNTITKSISNTEKTIADMIISDIDVEIIEKSPERENDNEHAIKIVPGPSSEGEIATEDYKSRFKSAKQYFQSLEELRPLTDIKENSLNECELLLQKPIQSTKPNVENEKTKKKTKRKVKSNSLPSYELKKLWSQFQEKDNENEKFVKISEKFHIDDLFNDVVGEGRLSRQGSFKGIPHKKAVLETFKSMENVSDNQLNSYEIAMSQLSAFAKENNVKNVQTYLSEYPYLPTTDPNKYHSRFDTKASGLISRRELLNAKPRRNSVPDLRMNATFVATL